MQYPLQEQIGDPELFVGRAKEFQNFGKWIEKIPKRLSKSRVILARRKSGKTAFVQRLFNQLWSENGAVIPFFFDLGENKHWLPDLAKKYYRAFASQYISFVERDAELVQKPLSLEKIREYGLAKSIRFFVDDVDSLIQDEKTPGYGLMWDTASAAPHRFAAVHDKRFLVILDEFQNFAQYVYRDEACERALDETMPGSYHSLSESKIAPMLVTGSYVGWLLEISGKYLQAGRLSRWMMTPYLTPEEGLRAVYTYAEVYDEPITNETALLINELCLSDPFFISCVMQSNYEDRDLTTTEGVINTVNYEITNRQSELSETWREYLEATLDRINSVYAKNMLLHLSEHADRYWTPRELKAELQLDDLDLNEIKQELVILAESDMIDRGVSDIDFRGLQDGTLNLVLRNRFEKEINNFVPDWKGEFHEQIKALQKENQRLQGMLSNLSGQMAEFQLAMSFRSKKRFALSAYFEGLQDTTRLNIIHVQHRVSLQRENGKRLELDVVAESDDGRVVVVEVKKTKDPINKTDIEDFLDKLQVYATHFPDKTILPAFLSLGGFTQPAAQLCTERGIGTAERITQF